MENVEGVEEQTSRRPKLAAQQLDAAFGVARRLVEQRDLPSAAMAVATANEVVRLELLSGELAVQPDTIFPIASISKVVTAVSVLQQVQAGAFQLGIPIARYLPEFRPAGVTAWHLLTHTSGLAEDIPLATMLRERPSAAHLFEQACRSRSVSAPGTRVAYNSLSFFVLAELVARTTGLPFARVQQHKLFTPLGMCDTSYDPTGASGRYYPLGVGRGLPSEELPITPEVWTAYAAELVAPGFGLWSTINDLVRFGQDLLRSATTGTGRALAPAYIELMTRDHTAGLVEEADGVTWPVHRGLGWRLTLPGMPGSPRAFSHGGAEAGLLWIDPAWDLVYVFLSNRECRQPTGERLPLQAVYAALRG